MQICSVRCQCITEALWILCTLRRRPLSNVEDAWGQQFWVSIYNQQYVFPTSHNHLEKYAF